MTAGPSRSRSDTASYRVPYRLPAAQDDGIAGRAFTAAGRRGRQARGRPAGPPAAPQPGKPPDGRSARTAGSA